ncbi:MAG TPA: DotU family type IV/VI secretion system protein [Thermoanaerobaculia bacterium]|jgi:hypothetical protein
MSADESIPFLTHELRIFLGQLDSIRRQIESRQRVGTGPGDLPRDPNAIRDRLAAQLRRQVADAQRDAYDSKSETFQHAQYLMARLADVTLNGFDWWGRGHMRRLTDDFPPPDGLATDVVVQIDQLLAEEMPSVELAEIYILTLAAGLEPARDDPKRQRQIEQRRQKLFTLVAQRRPELTVAQDPLLFPEAYAMTPDRGPVAYLPQVGGWAVALGIVLAALFVLSIVFYNEATRPLADTLKDTLKLLG